MSVDNPDLREQLVDVFQKAWHHADEHGDGEGTRTRAGIDAVLATGLVAIFQDPPAVTAPQGDFDCCVSESVDDPVNHPGHYTSHPSGVECIQITEHMGFNLGNAVKYIWRADEKGNALEDLEKARWYIDRELERRAKQ